MVVDYVDHHAAGAIPDHPNLTATISEAPEVCTALLVNGRLRGERVEWAITGAFGDNLDEPAQRLAEKSGLQAPDIAGLKELGVCINYNGYGPSLDDLHFHPDAFVRESLEAGRPQAFLGSSTFRQLEQGLPGGSCGLCGADTRRRGVRICGVSVAQCGVGETCQWRI